MNGFGNQAYDDALNTYDEIVQRTKYLQMTYHLLKKSFVVYHNGFLTWQESQVKSSDKDSSSGEAGYIYIYN